jgi:MerR family transcriptional regulator, mercuric resistance operon regulatory protein
MLRGTDPLTIGQLAERVHVSVETIRYYQGLGLLRVPAKPCGSIRHYGAADAKRVRFIRRAQGLGFTLQEVKALLSVSSGRQCAETQRIAARKLGDVEDQLSRLVIARARLKRLLAACAAHGTDCSCPIIESLLRDGADEVAEEPLQPTISTTSPDQVNSRAP